MKTHDLSEIYYVYAHYRPNDEIPFNIGKGKARRAWSKDRQNRWWHNIVNKYNGFDVCLLHENLKEYDALRLEAMYINAYGRADQGKGPLVNMTDGGEGMSGYKAPLEVRQAQSIRQTGKSLPKGRKHKEETKQKMRAYQSSRPSRGPVTEETKQKLRIAGMGNQNAKGHKQISHMRGKRHTEEANQKNREAHLGRRMAADTKLKMKESAIRAWKLRKLRNVAAKVK